MTGTSVKDVGLALGNLAAPQGMNAKNLSQSGFQKVWDNQSGKEKFDDASANTKTVVRKTPGESLKAKEEHRLRTTKEEPVSEADEALGELSEEQLEGAMEVLETAAAELTNRIADTFEVSVEEVQDAMEELGMESLDVLNPGKLGELLLKVSGAEDSYALVTNEELYNSYQDIMTQLKGVVQEAETKLEQELGLEFEEGQFTEFLEKMQEQPESLPAEKAAVPVIHVEDMREDADNKAVGTAQNMQDMQDTAQETVSVKEEGSSTETENGSGTEKRQHSTADKGESSNLLLQNLKQEQFQPEVRQTAQSTTSWSTDTQDIMRQIMDYMRIQVKSDMSDMEMQLHPQSLGTLQIHVASKGGVLTANFITQNEAVKSVLESQMIQLQQSFEEQGIKVNAIEVAVQTREFEKNPDQGRSDSQNREPARRNRIRRINLDDAAVPEELEQEDALAADMLAAGGNTVDYTA